MFKVGERLRFKTKEEIDANTRILFGWTKKMSCLHGEEFIVERIIGERYYSTTGIEKDWAISSDMLKSNSKVVNKFLDFSRS